MAFFYLKIHKRIFKTLVILFVCLFLIEYGLTDTSVSSHNNEFLAPRPALSNSLGRVEFRALMICEAIEKRARYGKPDEEIYLDDIILWVKSSEGEFTGCRFDVLPYEIRINLPKSNVIVRYFNPLRAEEIVSFPSVRINPSLYRQIIYSNVGMIKISAGDAAINPGAEPADIHSAIETLLAKWFDIKLPPYLEDCRIEFRQRDFEEFIQQYLPGAEFDFKDFNNSWSSFYKFHAGYCQDRETARHALFRIWQIYGKYKPLVEEVNRRVEGILKRDKGKLAGIIFLFEDRRNPMRNVSVVYSDVRKLGLNLEFLISEEDDIFGVGDVAHESGHGFIVDISGPPSSGLEESDELAANWAAAQILTVNELKDLLRYKIEVHSRDEGGIINPHTAAHLAALALVLKIEDKDILLPLLRCTTKELISRYVDYFLELGWLPSTTVPSVSSTGIGDEVQANRNIFKGILDIALAQNKIDKGEHKARTEDFDAIAERGHFPPTEYDIALDIDNKNVFLLYGYRIIVIDNIDVLSRTEEGEQYISAGMQRGNIYITRGKFEELKKQGILFLVRTIMHEIDETEYIRERARTLYPMFSDAAAFRRLSKEVLKNPLKAEEAKALIREAHDYAIERGSGREVREVRDLPNVDNRAMYVEDLDINIQVLRDNMEGLVEIMHLLAGKNRSSELEIIALFMGAKPGVITGIGYSGVESNIKVLLDKKSLLNILNLDFVFEKGSKLIFIYNKGKIRKLLGRCKFLLQGIHIKVPDSNCTDEELKDFIDKIFREVCLGNDLNTVNGIFLGFPVAQVVGIGHRRIGEEGIRNTGEIDFAKIVSKMAIPDRTEFISWLIKQCPFRYAMLGAHNSIYFEDQSGRIMDIKAIPDVEGCKVVLEKYIDRPFSLDLGLRRERVAIVRFVAKIINKTTDEIVKTIPLCSNHYYTFTELDETGTEIKRRYLCDGEILTPRLEDSEVEYVERAYRIYKGIKYFNEFRRLWAWEEILNKNRALFSTLLENNKPVVLRAPIEVIESLGVENVKDFLGIFQKASCGYVELYYISGAKAVDDEVYQKFGLERKPLPQDFKMTRENTITLFPVLKEKRITQKGLLLKLHKIGLEPTGTILSPIGFINDSTGFIRGTILGLRLMYIARQQRGLGRIDESFVHETLNQYRELCESQGVEQFNLSGQDLVDIAIGDINKLAKALRKLIKLLPITPIDVEELRDIYENSKQVLTAA